LQLAFVKGLMMIYELYMMMRMRRMMRTRSAAVRSQVEYDPHKPNADILDK